MSRTDLLDLIDDLSKRQIAPEAVIISGFTLTQLLPKFLGKLNPGSDYIINGKGIHEIEQTTKREDNNDETCVE